MPKHRAVHIDQRASAVAGIDGSVGLQVGERLGGIGLAGERTDHAHGDRILQTFRTADGEHELADAGALRADQRKRGQIGFIDFEQGEIGFLVLADQAGLENAALPDRHLSGRVAHGQRQNHDQRPRGRGRATHSRGSAAAHGRLCRTSADWEAPDLEARLVGQHKETDLALLKIDETDLPTLPLVSPQRPRVAPLVFRHRQS